MFHSDKMKYNIILHGVILDLLQQHGPECIFSGKVTAAGNVGPIWENNLSCQKRILCFTVYLSMIVKVPVMQPADEQTI